MPGLGQRLVVPLDQGWSLARGPAGNGSDRSLEALEWLPAQVPGTAAGALRAAGLWQQGMPRQFDDEDWWFRTRFHLESLDSDERIFIHLEGVATVFRVMLNGRELLTGESMFESHRADISALVRSQDNELLIRCHALNRLLTQRGRPRARWRTGLANGQLRWFRTTLLGRAPSLGPVPAAVGPWREVWLERRTGTVVEDVRWRAKVADRTGLASVRVCLDGPAADAPGNLRAEITGPAGTFCEDLQVRGRIATGEVALSDVSLWWPHTHGEPVLYHAAISADGTTVSTFRLGFRRLESFARPDGFDIKVNDVPVFCRGALWNPVDPVSLTPSDAAVAETLMRARDCGMNMLRIPGTGFYESRTFLELCDELGLLLWQDLMFANFDYPLRSEAFAAVATSEVTGVLDSLGQHACLAVICGNSEVEQQAALMGAAPSDWRDEFFAATVPDLMSSSDTDALYVPSAPCGGPFPFRTRVGVASYFGVGAYGRRPDSTRSADVSFAAECLAFANVPDDDVVDLLGPVFGPKWKAAVPRDAGVSWDFDDVRDHYLRMLYEVNPADVRRTDQEHYLRLSRIVSAEVMSGVFAEWRRPASRCGGGLILSLRDIVPGAGWGLLDANGKPKVAWQHLRRALAPVAVWTTDEGLNGIDIHVANDGPSRLSARLRVVIYAHDSTVVQDASREIEVPAHSARTWETEEVLGRFVDASLAYRFGPPGHNAIAVRLEQPANGEITVLARAFNFLGRWPAAPESASFLGIAADAWMAPDQAIRVRLRADHVLYGARISATGFIPDDDSFVLEPASERVIRLRAAGQSNAPQRCVITAVNLDKRITLPIRDGE